MCIDASYTPGRFTWPLMQYSFGPPFFSGPSAGEPLRAVEDDERHVAQRLDVVDGGRTLIETRDRRERRLDARLRSFPFERFDQRCLLPGFVRTGTPVHVDVAVETAAEDVLARGTRRRYASSIARSSVSCT